MSLTSPQEPLLNRFSFPISSRRNKLRLFALVSAELSLIVNTIALVSTFLFLTLRFDFVSAATNVFKVTVAFGVYFALHVLDLLVLFVVFSRSFVWRFLRQCAAVDLAFSLLGMVACSAMIFTQGLNHNREVLGLAFGLCSLRALSRSRLHLRFRILLESTSDFGSQLAGEILSDDVEGCDDARILKGIQAKSNEPITRRRSFLGERPPYSVFQTLVKVVRWLARGQRIRFVTTLVLIGAWVSFLPVQTVLIGELVAAAENRDAEAFRLSAALYGASYAFAQVLYILVRNAVAKLSGHAMVRLNSTLVCAAIGEEEREPGAGELASVASVDLERVASLNQVCMFLGARSTFSLVVGMGFICRSDPVTAALLLGVLPAMLAPRLFEASAVAASMRFTDSKARLLNDFVNALAIRRVARAFSAATWLRSRLAPLVLRTNLAREESKRSAANIQIWLSSCVYGAIVMTTIGFAMRFFDGELDAPDFFVLCGLAKDLCQPFLDISRFLRSALDVTGSVQAVDELLMLVDNDDDDDHDECTRADTHSPPTPFSKWSGGRSLEIEDVHFGALCATEMLPSIKSAEMVAAAAIDTPGSTPSTAQGYVLDGLSLSVESGSFVRIHGDSGGGKSTLIALLTGLARPEVGDIKQGNGVSIYDDLDSYRRSLGVVFQDCRLCNGTIRDNIAFSREVSDADIWLSAQHAEIACFIASLPRGLDTIVGEGANGYSKCHIRGLSGGQRSRICLARALCGAPQLLLLDEVTAAIDADTTMAIVKTLHRLSRERGTTVVLVTHESTDSELCDDIINVVLKDGRAILHE